MPKRGDEREAMLYAMVKDAQTVTIEAVAGIYRVSRPVIDPDDPARARDRNPLFSASRPEVAPTAGTRHRGGGLKPFASRWPDRMIGLSAQAEKGRW